MSAKTFYPNIYSELLLFGVYVICVINLIVNQPFKKYNTLVITIFLLLMGVSIFKRLKAITKVTINDHEIYLQSFFSKAKKSVIKLCDIEKIINIELNNAFFGFRIFDKYGKEISFDNDSITLNNKCALHTELLSRIMDFNIEFETQQSQHFAHQSITFRKKKK